MFHGGVGRNTLERDGYPGSEYETGYPLFLKFSSAASSESSTCHFFSSPALSFLNTSSNQEAQMHLKVERG